MSETGVQSVSKEGDYYVIKGRVRGRDESVHIPSPTVEGRSREDATKLFKRSLENASNQ